MKSPFRWFLSFLVAAAFLVFPSPIMAQEVGATCAVYFTGVGCGHCAQTDPVVLGRLLDKFPKLVIIEYEIYQQPENAPLLSEYNEVYGSGLGIPLLVFNANDALAGDRTVLGSVASCLERLEGNPCPLVDGSSQRFGELDFSTLPGRPKIWAGERVLIRRPSAAGEVGNELLQELLVGEDFISTLRGLAPGEVVPQPVALSGSSREFDHAASFAGWLFQWDGASLGEVLAETDPRYELPDIITQPEESCPDLTLTKVLSLAAVDAVNPCALAVLTLLLFTVLAYNSGEKRRVLWAGLAFSASVLVMYLIYGLVIIRFFQLVQALASVRLWLYKILGLVAMVLGALNVKDFFAYKPGGLGTEMPMSLRPKVQRLISRATGPRAAAVAGALVTLFLLPCTIGPYVICGGILSRLALIKTVPWLLLYNAIFVLPMLAITVVCYVGLTTVEKVAGWKDRNIKYLHLLAGLLIFGLGLAMLFGWV